MVENHMNTITSVDMIVFLFFVDVKYLVCWCMIYAI